MAFPIIAYLLLAVAFYGWMDWTARSTPVQD